MRATIWPWFMFLLVAAAYSGGSEFDTTDAGILRPGERQHVVAMLASKTSVGRRQRPQPHRIHRSDHVRQLL